MCSSVSLCKNKANLSYFPKLKANHSRRYELLGRAYIAMANKETVRFKIDNGELRSTKCHDLDTGFSTLIDIVN